MDRAPRNREKTAGGARQERTGSMQSDNADWPPRPYADWHVSCATPFDQERILGGYAPVQANGFWLALAQSDRVFAAFRGHFVGKVTPVRFFWGSFDLAVTRFSGRRAPPPPSSPNIPDAVNREAYSHEVSSAGFWPGNGGFGQAAFYSYAYPQPPGFADAKIRPSAGYYDKNIGEFILPYEALRRSADPSATLLEFLQSTYAAAADLGKWDRSALER